MKKKKHITKIMAFLALFWIIIWIIGTWLLIIFWWQNSQTQTLTPEEYEQLQELIRSQSWSIEISTWTTIIENSWAIVQPEIEVSTDELTD